MSSRTRRTRKFSVPIVLTVATLAGAACEVRSSTSNPPFGDGDGDGDDSVNPPQGDGDGDINPPPGDGDGDLSVNPPFPPLGGSGGEGGAGGAGGSDS